MIDDDKRIELIIFIGVPIIIGDFISSNPRLLVEIHRCTTSSYTPPVSPLGFNRDMMSAATYTYKIIKFEVKVEIKCILL